MVLSGVSWRPSWTSHKLIIHNSFLALFTTLYLNLSFFRDGRSSNARPRICLWDICYTCTSPSLVVIHLSFLEGVRNRSSQPSGTPLHHKLDSVLPTYLSLESVLHPSRKVLTRSFGSQVSSYCTCFWCVPCPFYTHPTPLSFPSYPCVECTNLLLWDLSEVILNTLKVSWGGRNVIKC